MITSTLQRVRDDQTGAAAVEFVLALPVLVTLMIAILQFGLILQAQGAMRHGIGEGLRMAKVNAVATETQILDRARASMSGIDMNNVTSMSFTRGTSSVGGEVADWGRITVNYEMQPIIPFAPLPPIRLNATRRVYLPT
jgi:Flp pilus assembly protein TadG